MGGGEVGKRSRNRGGKVGFPTSLKYMQFATKRWWHTTLNLL